MVGLGVTADNKCKTSNSNTTEDKAGGISEGTTASESVKVSAPN